MDPSPFFAPAVGKRGPGENGSVPFFVDLFRGMGRAMKKPEFTVRAALNRGKAAATLWTCDLSFDYVKINAEYRT